ncbi:MAG: LytR C-terminal domain-containing protein [bacterium]
MKSVIAPAVSALSTGSSNLRGKDIYSLLLVERDSSDVIKRAKLLLVQTVDHKLYSIDVAPDVKVDLPGRLGEEEYQKIYKLARTLDGEFNGAVLLTEATKKLLQVNVDRYLVMEGPAFNLVDGAVFHKELGLLFPWESLKLVEQAETNLSAGELLDIVIFARGLRQLEREEINPEQIADLGLKLRDVTLSGAVAQENLGVVVLNGTGVPNMAKEVSDVLWNMGGRISLAGNAENVYEHSYLITDDAFSATVKYISDFYPDIKIINKSAAASLGEDLLDRGDICLIVGFDILAQLE